MKQMKLQNSVQDSQPSPSHTMANFEYKKSYTKIQRKQFVENMLNEQFPLIPVIISTVFDVLLAVAAIGVQIAQISLQTSVYFIGCGIWTGFFVLLADLFTIVLMFRRKYRLFLITLILQLFSFCISLSLVIAYGIMSASTHDHMWTDYTLLAIGCLLKLPSILFFGSFLVVYLIYRRVFPTDSYYIRH